MKGYMYFWTNTSDFLVGSLSQRTKSEAEASSGAELGSECEGGLWQLGPRQESGICAFTVRQPFPSLSLGVTS